MARLLHVALIASVLTVFSLGAETSAFAARHCVHRHCKHTAAVRFWRPGYYGGKHPRKYERY